LSSGPRRFAGYFTLIVGAFTALDFLYSLFEPVPPVLYVLAAPKLPLSAAWNMATGVLLLRPGKLTT